MGARIPGFPGTLETKVFSALKSLVFQGSRTPDILGAPESNEFQGLRKPGFYKGVLESKGPGTQAFEGPWNPRSSRDTRISGVPVVLVRNPRCSMEVWIPGVKGPSKVFQGPWNLEHVHVSTGPILWGYLHIYEFVKLSKSRNPGFQPWNCLSDKSC